MATKPSTTKPAAGKSLNAKPPVGKTPGKVTKLQAVPDLPVEAEGAAAKLVAQLRVKDLIDRVVDATEQSRKDAKIIVEAALEEIAKALAAGDVLNLPPLGKIRIANQRSGEDGVAMTLKLRRNSEKAQAKKGEKQALAEVGEAG